jgi:hypothetical protein
MGLFIESRVDCDMWLIAVSGSLEGSGNLELGLGTAKAEKVRSAGRLLAQRM